MDMYRQIEQLLEGARFGRYTDVEYTEVLAPGVLPGVMVGDTVRVTVSVKYRGPEVVDTELYGAIGDVLLGVFNEVWVGKKNVTLARSNEWSAALTYSVDIPITAVGILPWSPGLKDIYVKFTAFGVKTDTLLDKIELVLVSEFKDFAITEYIKV